ncbi:MAG: hypothetical protein AAF543_12885 [Pseudomonadota bacterium]
MTGAEPVRPIVAEGAPAGLRRKVSLGGLLDQRFQIIAIGGAGLPNAEDDGCQAKAERKTPPARRPAAFNDGVQTST